MDDIKSNSTIEHIHDRASSSELQASNILFTMAKESDIQATDTIHHIENELNEKDDDNELKTPLGSENAHLFLSCVLDSLKTKKWYARGAE